MEHEIIRDHVTKRSRGFGFIIFDNDQVVDTILTNGNMIDMEGTQVSFVQSVAKISDVQGHSLSVFKSAKLDYAKVSFPCSIVDGSYLALLTSIFILSSSFGKITELLIIFHFV